MKTKFIGQASPMVWYIQFLWHMVEWVGCKRECNEEYGKDSNEEGVQLVRTKLGKGGERGRLAIGLGRSITEINFICLMSHGTDTGNYKNVKYWNLVPY